MMTRLPGSARSVPAWYAIYFSVFCILGAGWGLLVRTPHPGVSTMAPYPNVGALLPLNGKPVGLASPRPGVTTYRFQTNDSPEAVLSFYDVLMRSSYGFQAWWVETPAPGLTRVHFVRETAHRYFEGPPAGARDKEVVTVEITSESGEPTTVEVSIENQPAVR
jgi:hypothetical protein